MKKISLLLVFCLALSCAVLPFSAAAVHQKEPEMGAFSYGDMIIEEVEYTRKVDSIFFFEGELPQYNYGGPNGGKACALNATANIIGYYDKWYPQLIPNFTSYFFYSNGQLGYNFQNAAVSAMMYDLIDVMGNVANGYTVSQVKNGLVAYTSGKGLFAAYSSVMQSGSFSFDKYVYEMSVGRPVFLGLSQYHMAEIGTSGNTDYLGYSYPLTNDNHAMVGYGYRIIQYYRLETKLVWSPTLLNPFRYITVTEEVNFRNETFLMVQEGDALCYLNINHSFNAFDAFGVWIGN